MKVSVLFLLLALLFNVAGNIFFKFSSQVMDKRMVSALLLVTGLLFGGMNAFFYTKSLRFIELNIAYPLFSAGSIILITAVSFILFHESLTMVKIVGIVLLSAGIALIAHGGRL